MKDGDFFLINNFTFKEFDSREARIRREVQDAIEKASGGDFIENLKKGNPNSYTNNYKKLYGEIDPSMNIYLV